jgi:hypothetical protein
MNIGKRVEIEKELDSVLVHIKTRKNIILLLFIGFWLIFWAFSVITTLGKILSGDSENGAVTLWLCGWLTGGTLLLFIWLWNAFGREVVILNKENFIYRREIFGFALMKKTVPIEKLSYLRPADFYGSMFSFNNMMEQWGFNRGMVVVDEDRDTHRFGLWLEEKEAKALIETIKPYFHRTSNKSLDARRNQLLS